MDIHPESGIQQATLHEETLFALLHIGKHTDRHAAIMLPEHLHALRRPAFQRFLESARHDDVIH